MATKVELISPENRALLAASIAYAGPQFDDESDEEYEARIMEASVAVYAMESAHSRIGKWIETLTNVEGVKGAGAFKATIVATEEQHKMQREFVYLHAYNRDADEVQEEVIRTPQFYHPIGKRIAKQAKSLIGHQVVVYKRPEQFKDPKKGMLTTNILVGIDDWGVDEDYEIDEEGAYRKDGFEPRQKGE